MSFKDKKNEINFAVDSSIYPKEALLATAYVFLDRFYVFLDQENKKIIIRLKPKERTKRKADDCKGEFMNELLNNALRFMISKRNQKIRDMIIKEALFFSQPQDGIDAYLFKKK